MKRRSFFKVLGAAAVACVLPFPKMLFGKSKPHVCYWKPGADGLWDDPENWTQGRVPQDGDSVAILNGGTILCERGHDPVQIDILTTRGTEDKQAIIMAIPQKSTINSMVMLENARVSMRCSFATNELSFAA